MSDEQQMTFLNHLEELRWRLVRIAIAILVFAVAIWVFQEWIMDHIFLSMKDPDFFSFKLMCEHLGVCVNEIPIKMQSMTVSGQFSYALMMSIMGGIIVAFPFIFYQIWAFIKPGLKHQEKSVAKGIVLYVSLLFFLGIAFGYFIVAPLAVHYGATT